MLKSNCDGNDSFVVIQNEESMVGQGTRRKHERGGINKKVAILSFLSIIWLCQLLITPLVFAEYGLKTTIINPDDDSDTRFGYSLAVSDEYIIVGAYLSDIGEVTEAGKVYLFDHDGNFVKSLELENPQDFDWFGIELNFDADLLLVTEGDIGKRPGYSRDYPGSVHVFDADGTFKFQLDPPEIDVLGTFGLCTEVLSDRILVGQPSADTEYGVNTGRVLEYDKEGNFLHAYYSPILKEHGFFSWEITADEDIIVVTENHGFGLADPIDGYISIFDKNWNLIETLANPGGHGNLDQPNLFGMSIALTEDYLLVGDSIAHLDGLPNAGCIYVYNKQGEELRNITSPKVSSVENFGDNFVVDNELLYVGVPGNDDEVIDSGKVYVFDLEGVLVEELVSPEPSFKGYFGSSVVVYGDNIFVGEIGENKVHIYSEGVTRESQVEQTTSQPTTQTMEETSENTGIPGYPIWSIAIAIILVSIIIYMRHNR